MTSVCILGGYGVFGSLITETLAQDLIPVIIAGRDQSKADVLAEKLKKLYPQANIKTANIDINNNLVAELEKLKPKIIINTVGPFQDRNYAAAKACINLGINYIDLADNRDFVNHISTLDTEAKKNNVLIITGASTVPGLSSAVIEYFKSEFKQINNITYGISPGGKAPRGIATAKPILNYMGKPIKTLSNNSVLYGWQDIHKINYPELGYRWMANCDIPDLDLFPSKYSVNQIRFYAGMESALLHWGMWLTSWLVRLGLPINLSNHAESLVKLSHLFDFQGTDTGGMHMFISGIDLHGKPLTLKWFLIAKNGDGPHIPTIPSIILTRKILNNSLDITGAYPCMGLITLSEYQDALKNYKINYYTFRGSQLK